MSASRVHGGLETRRITATVARPKPCRHTRKPTAHPVRSDPKRTRCNDARVVTESPVVIKLSPMAHIAVGFLTLCLLVPVTAFPLSAPILVIPVLLSALIIRLRTVADERGVTVRTLLGSQSVAWEDIDGLRFHRGNWARAHLKNGSELRLPAVTFATLPQLTEASAGRVPNPYR